MTVRLTVKQRSEEGGAEKPQVVLLEDDIITLGREQSCQVVLAQSAVSRSHARISRDGTLFFVEDLGSSYGTQINGKKLPKGEKHLLRNGDVIVIAQFDVTFDRVAEGQGENGAGNTQFVARKVVKDVMRGLGAGGEQPYFRYMNGPKEGKRIDIADAQEYVIGREEGVEILLVDDLVSRKHAKVRRDWSGTHVEDLNSRNGIKVNKKKVKKKTLKDRDELEVGGTRMLYIDPTEVREAPVVLPDQDDGENTIAPPPDEEVKPPGAKTKVTEDEPPKEEPPAEEPKKEEEASAEAAASESQEAPPPEGEGGEEGLEGATNDLPEGEEGEPQGLIESIISNKQTLVLFIVAGVVGLGAIIFLIMVLAGA